MKKCYVRLAVIAFLCCVGIALYQNVASSHVDAFAVRHQALLEKFLSLARAEADEHGLGAIYTRWDDKRLVGSPRFFLPDSSASPVSSELHSVWQNIRQKGHFTSVSCSFEPDGAMEAHFSVEGPWQSYEEGNYKHCNCLIWRDADYSQTPPESLDPMTEVEGMSPSSEGRWYWTSHKHYDG